LKKRLVMSGYFFILKKFNLISDVEGVNNLVNN
jgi:hypothetical protein